MFRRLRAWQGLRVEVIGFFALLFVVDSYLYFRHAAHFFQADSVYLLSHRASSVTGFLREFTTLHPSGWYRPLANEAFESILYPIFGLNPIPYRVPVYAVFLMVSIAVYALVFAIGRRHLAAALATFFFSIHTTNAYTTYDVGFMPELLYTLFYICSVLAYMRYVRSGTKSAYRLSLAFFIASLWSKEAAVTLPATLIALHLLLDGQARGMRAKFVRVTRSAVPHLLILFVYLVFALGYLHVMSVNITKLLDRPEKSAEVGYNLVLDDTVLKNADVAASLAFNIPRGWWGQWQHPTPAMMNYLKFFRGLVFALMIVLLIRPERKMLLFGVAWFFITALPALPLLNHFIPYYMFLPIAGLSLVIATVFVWTHDSLRRIQPFVAWTFTVLMFAGMLYVTSHSIAADIRDNRLLGRSAQIAFTSLTDMKRLHPTLPPKATIYFNDIDLPLHWEHSWGGLLGMAYRNDEITALYASLDDLVPEKTSDDLLLLRVRDNRLIDETSEYRANPNRFIRYIDSGVYKLVLTAKEVTAGGTYALNIHGAKEGPVRITYTVNNGLVESFTAVLDVEGKATFNVSPQTRKGIYQFLGFNIPGQSRWIRASDTITVR